MNKLIYLFLIISSVVVKAEDITFEDFTKILTNQSEVCQITSAFRISAYCILHAEPKYFKPFPYCVVRMGPISSLDSADLLGRLSLACDEEWGLIEQVEGLAKNEKTGSEIKDLIKPWARCMLPVADKAIEEYGCHVFDQPQVFELLKSEHLLNPEKSLNGLIPKWKK